MKREEARQYIKSLAKTYLQPDKSAKGYICPICGSGTGKNGTGITTKDGVHFTCWGGGCFTNADIIDIIGKKYGLTSYKEKFQAAVKEFNISIDENYSQKKEKEKPKQDYTEFFLQANKNISKTKYHRGLSLDTLNRFKIGFVENWKNPKAPNVSPTPRLIIPIGKYSYLARDTRPNLTEKQKKYNKIKVGKVKIFNSKVLQSAKQPIFVVEGEIDALSIIDVGGEAIALGSTSNVNVLLKYLESHKPSQPLVVAMDNDDAGRKTTETLIKGLKGLKFQFFSLGIPRPYKDANEALNANRDVLKAIVDEANKIEAQKRQSEHENLKEELKKETVAHSLKSFLQDIEKYKNASFFPTGFSNVDDLLDGGLYAGLYIVGAISSLGKTTFCLQIADHIAKNGHDVIIFSLEMARNELIAKSLSRLSFIGDLKKNNTTKNAKSTRDILTGCRYKNYSLQEKDLIKSSISSYEEYAHNIYITEVIGDLGTDEIRERVKKHVEITGKSPVIIIDYLQIIAPADMRATDKQNTDRAVWELKRLSRDYGIPVVGISSFNRDNYNAPVNLASFKESGAIEYSSDVLIGLQYSGMDYNKKESEKDRLYRIKDILDEALKAGKKGQAQKIDVKILKNRNGSKGSALLHFYPMFNYFSENLEVTSADGWKISKSDLRKS